MAKKINTTRSLEMMCVSLWDPEGAARKWEERPEEIARRSSSIRLHSQDEQPVLELLITQQKQLIENSLKQRDTLDARRGSLLSAALGAIPVTGGLVAWAYQRGAGIWTIPLVATTIAVALVALRARLTAAMRSWPSVRALLEVLDDGIPIGGVRRAVLNSLLQSENSIRADNNVMASQVNAIAWLLFFLAIVFSVTLAITYCVAPSVPPSGGAAPPALITNPP